MPTDSLATLLLLALVVVFTGLMAVFRVIVRSRQDVPLRPIAGYTAVPRLQGRSVETGQSLHMSLGTAGVGGIDTAATLAGLAVLQMVTDEAVASDSPPTITVSDPTTMLLAQDVLRRSYVRQHIAASYDPRSVRFVAAAPIPYGAAVMDLLAHEETAANVMAGAFGLEAALIAEEGSRQGITQVVGTSNATTLPLLYPSSDYLLIGEEIFVSSAYGGPDSTGLASVLAQDVIRWLAVGAILVLGLLNLFR